MAALNPELRHCAVLALCAVLGGARPAYGGPADQPIDLEAASSDFDYKNGVLNFKRIRITQGGTRIEADEATATGLNFDDSKWQFRGQVRITVPDGKLESSDAIVEFRNNQIVHARITGRPAAFEQRLKESRKLAQGRAGTIEYDVQASTVRLRESAWLTDGQNEIRGDTLVYDIGRQRVQANPDQTDTGGVRITINPTTPPKTPAP